MSTRRRDRSLFAGWRLWLGLGVTAIAVYWTLRGVDLEGIATSISRARWLPILLMLPLHPLGLYVRALRWRHLAARIDSRPLSTGSLFRATAVGFMAINLFPFRVGELVRPWFLARETGVRGSAALGTLLLERAIDFATLLLIGAGVLYFHTQSFPAWVRSGAIILAALAGVPLGLVAAMRVHEEGTLRAMKTLVRPLPGWLAEPTLQVLLEVCRGLSSLQGFRAVAMVMLHSGLLWGVFIAGPFALGLLAFDIQLATPKAFLAVYTLLVFTALAVAAPAAPGFFGVYHFACREALTLFGISSASAVAYGTVLHLGYWIPVTLVGSIVAARAGTRLTDLRTSELGKGPSEPHR